MLTKEQILSITDDAKQELEIPEWGGSVFIRGMTLADLEYCQSLENQEDPHSVEKMIIRFICDESGNPLFSEADLPALRNKSIQAFRRITKQIKNFNSLEGVEKNSDSRAD